MRQPIFLELFSGNGTLAAAARSAGMMALTVDIDPKRKPDICIDILNLRRSLLPGRVDVIWASPPCTQFSLLQAANHWESTPIGYRMYHHKPLTQGAFQALRIIRATARLICQLNPTFYFIENPRAILRHRPEMVFVPYRKTVRYSDYGAAYEKPTDIFTNCKYFQPIQSRRPVGLKQLTEVPTVEERAAIPGLLAKEVINTCLTHLTGQWVLTPEINLNPCGIDPSV